MKSKFKTATDFRRSLEDRLHTMALTTGAILCKGKRTVTGILRTLGLSQDSGFSKYHRISNSLGWSAKRGSVILLKILLKMVGEGRPVFLIDETLERLFREYLSYDNVGHMILSPYAPVETKAILHPVTQCEMEVGGQAEAQAAACRDSWVKILDFYKQLRR